MLTTVLCTLALTVAQENEAEAAPFLNKIPMLHHLFEDNAAALPNHAPTQTDLPQGFDFGFENARRVRLTQHSGRGSELVYLFGAAPIQLEDAPARSWMGAMSFRDRFVVSRLQEISDELKVELVDRIESRTRGGRSATTAERTVEVTGPEPLVTRALDYLEALTAANQKQVLIEAVLLVSPINPNSNAEITIHALDKAEFESTATNLQKNDVLSVPSVLVNGGSNANITTINQVAYIADFEIEVANEAVIANPIVDTLQTGLVLRLSPVITPSGQIVIDADLQISDLRRPIPTMSITLAGSPVEVELPELSQTRWTSQDLRFTEGTHGLHVRGIRIQQYDNDGQLTTSELQVLMHATAMEGSHLSNAGALGNVVGVDTDAGYAFVRIPSVSHGGDNALVQFLRNGETVGRGQVTEVDGGLAIVRIIEGTIKRGDRVR